jgi:hypothetical protein
VISGVALNVRHLGKPLPTRSPNLLGELSDGLRGTWPKSFTFSCHRHEIIFRRFIHQCTDYFATGAHLGHAAGLAEADADV